jgi:hypothetical protein
MRTTPKRTQLYSLRDFTGGLNLVTDAFKLQENESPDLLNVDIDRRGGFQVRRGVYPYSATALSAAPNTIWSYNDAGTVYTMVQVGTGVRYSTGSAWTNLTRLVSSVATDDLGTADGTDVCPVVFNDVCYWARGDRNIVKWDGGANATVLNRDFNDTTIATSGNVPRADHMAVHSGYLWVAGTWELNDVGATVHHPNRVRWSWANTFDNAAENWRKDDYIDIDDGKDSDSITAIVPFGDQLIVFKRDSVYGVYGYSGESFSVVNISNTVGAVSHQAAIATPAGLFFFDHQTGLNVYNGKAVAWVFEQIWPAMRDGSIPSSQVDNVDLGWIENRLWVSVPWDEFPSIPRAYTFVLDPRLKPGGSWTKYSLQAGPFARGHRSQDYLGYLHGTNRIYRLDVHDQYYDYFNAGAGPTAIDAYYQTKWIDLGEPAIKKRWRRTEVVMQVDQGYELPVVSYSDYDSTTSVKNFKFDALPSVSGATDGIWDDVASDWGGIAGGVVTDGADWARSGVYGYVDRGATLGIARSVSLKVGGQVKTIPTPGLPQAPVFWGVDALIFKYVPRRVR